MGKKTFKIPSYFYFILATVIIIILFPREGTFRYSFSENRPWSYGRLAAPFDFPIYKSAEEIAQEQDSVRNNVKSYFRIDKDIYTIQLEKLEGLMTGSNVLSNSFRQTIRKRLDDVYKNGVISDADYQILMDKGASAIMVIGQDEKGIAEEILVKDIYTVSKANEEFAKKIPFNLNLANDIQANLVYDPDFTEKVKQEEVQKISPSMGMVQAGEKIIDRGEIVTSRIGHILNSLKQIYAQNSGASQKQVGVLSGIVLLVSGLMICLLLYFIFLRKKFYANSRDIICILSLSTVFIVLTEIAIKYELFNVYIIPYAIIPIVIRTFFDSRTAQITHLITIAICALMIPASFEFFLIQLIVCMVLIYVLKDLTQRSELIKCAFYILCSYILVYLSYLLYQEGDFSKISWEMLLYFGINFIFVMFTYSLIFIIEKIFGYISNVTLVELSDINRPALRELSESCPGTFQHSLQVSMLGTAAAAKVGANPQLIRTGALYHDLGKMQNPGYYTENKIGDINPHDSLSLEESARIITSHVPNGVKIAEKHDIPPALVKFIQTHHGKGKAKYFYNTYKNQHPGEPINEEAFSYEGMNPDTKETAILMMADAVEAASRSLHEYSEESIRNLVNKIIDSQIADGLLSEAPLTFKNITDIKNVFIERLMSVYHSRIAYPELKEKKEN